MRTGLLCLAAAAAAAASVATANAETANELSEQDALFEGDIVADYERLYVEYGYDTAEKVADEGIVARPEARRLDAIISDKYIWPKDDDGVVRVPITFTSAFTTAQVNAIKGYYDDLASQAGSWLEFVDYTDQANYVEIISGSGCYSSVGFYRGRQELSLKTSGCISRGVAQHEMLHTLGFWHEQSRPDRDDYVTVNFDNIATGKAHNFNKRNSRAFNSPYDFASVMHYRSMAFSKNGKPTIVPKVSGVTIGQRAGPSEGDLLQLRILYDDPTVTAYPTMQPTPPTNSPTPQPTADPASPPTERPTNFPTSSPTPKPTGVPTERPTNYPTSAPTRKPTAYPTSRPTSYPTSRPTAPTTLAPTDMPTPAPTKVCSKDDENVWNEVRPDALEDYGSLRLCAEQCTAASNETCVADCIAAEAGFTSSCSSCFADYVVCIETVCACTYNTSDASCEQCAEVETCDATFNECTMVLSAVRYDTNGGSSAGASGGGASASMIGVVGGVGGGLAFVLLASFALVARRRRRRRDAKSTRPLGFGEADPSARRGKKASNEQQFQMAAPSFHRQTSFDF